MQRKSGSIFFALCFIFGGPSPTQATEVNYIQMDPKFAYSRARDCVESARFQHPLIVADPEDSYSHISNLPQEPVPKVIIDIQKKIELATFGSTGNFKIVYMPSDKNYIAATHLKSRTIELGYYYNYLFNLINIIPPQERTTQMAYLIAHEMGHYFSILCLKPQESEAHGQVDAIGLYLMELAHMDIEPLRKNASYIKRMLKTEDPNYEDLPQTKAQRDSREEFVQSYFNSHPH